MRKLVLTAVAFRMEWCSFKMVIMWWSQRYNSSITEAIILGLLIHQSRVQSYLKALNNTSHLKVQVKNTWDTSSIEMNLVEEALDLKSLTITRRWTPLLEADFQFKKCRTWGRWASKTQLSPTRKYLLIQYCDRATQLTFSRRLINCRNWRFQQTMAVLEAREQRFYGSCNWNRKSRKTQVWLFRPRLADSKLTSFHKTQELI